MPTTQTQRGSTGNEIDIIQGCISAIEDAVLAVNFIETNWANRSDASDMVHEKVSTIQQNLSSLRRYLNSDLSAFGGTPNTIGQTGVGGYVPKRFNQR